MITSKIVEYGDKLVEKNTSEEILGVSVPPEYQCTYIDSLIREVEEAQSDIQDADYYISWEKLDKAEKHINNLEKIFKGVPDELEQLRSSIIQLRQWGDEWKMIAKWLIEKTDVTVEEVIEYVKDNKEDN